MTVDPSPRQVLYALVAAGFLVVVAILTVAAAAAGLAPGWWTATMAGMLAVGTTLGVLRWRRTGLVLGVSIGLFVFWTVGTLIFA